MEILKINYKSQELIKFDWNQCVQYKNQKKFVEFKKVVQWTKYVQ